MSSRVAGHQFCIWDVLKSDLYSRVNLYRSSKRVSPTCTFSPSRVLAVFFFAWYLAAGLNPSSPQMRLRLGSPTFAISHPGFVSRLRQNIFDCQTPGTRKNDILLSLGYVNKKDRHPRAPPQTACAATEYDITPVHGKESELRRAALLWVESFWAAGTIQGPMPLWDEGHKLLNEDALDDFFEGYGEIRFLRSECFVAKHVGTDDMAGCVGIEMMLVNPETWQKPERLQAELLVQQKLDVIGEHEGERYKKLGASHQVQELQVHFPDYRVFGLLCNLAVAPSARRSGLARLLCSKVEEKSAEWGLPSIILSVDLDNGPARALYQAIGYEDKFYGEDREAGRLKLTEFGAYLDQHDEQFVIMCKHLKQH